MAKQFFITGTDTDAGKTFCACVLAKKFREAGLQVRPYKPIVAGFENGHNADLDSHIRACGLPLKPHDITTFAYQEAIAPHIAAEHENNPIDFKQLDLDLHKAVNSGADVVITEGAGGWFLPVSSTAAALYCISFFPSLNLIHYPLRFQKHRSETVFACGKTIPLSHTVQ